eukprot:m.14447 g.14447  ORF g.14447 m.14447 type:complete len:151 (+) comp4314_c0_seq1:107-559(+)
MTAEDDKRLAADVLGYMTAAGLTILLLPQVFKTYKAKHTMGLSHKMNITNFFIAICGIAYAVLIGEIPLLVGEVVVFFCAGSLIIMNLNYKGNTKKMKEMHQKYLKLEEQEAKNLEDAFHANVVVEDGMAHVDTNSSIAAFIEGNGDVCE